MALNEAQLYNLFNSSGVSQDIVIQLAAKYANEMMIKHLYTQHDMGIREISRELKLKQNYVSSVVKTFDSDMKAI